MVYDVVIAGGGPVGLLLACELRLGGCSVLVLEQAADPASPHKRMPFGMRGLWGPSVEAFHRRGLLDQLLEAGDGSPGPRPGSMRATEGPAGHFAGIQFDYRNIDSSRWPYRLPGPADTQVGVTMERLETVLAGRARALGVELRRGHAVERIEMRDDGVTVDGIEARWLAGCDGGHSTVRKLAGFDFTGTEPELTGYSLQVELSEPLPSGRHWTAHGNYTQWQAGAIGVVEFDGGAMHRKEITIEHAQEVLRRVSGRAVTVTALGSCATWTDRSMQATSYRRGRVLLAGDAAHIHSPLGGQGLNLGLGDAMNLGWKLACVVHGSPGELLDSYTTERHPIGARILDWTRAQVAVMRPSSRALEPILRDLMATRDGATYFAERVWNVLLRYDLGDPHPLVGASCPDFEFVDGTRVGELLRTGRGLLLDFDGVLSPIDGVTRLTTEVRDRRGLTALLVRPDGVVAWAGTNRDELQRAAARWFSPSRTRR